MHVALVRGFTVNFEIMNRLRELFEDPEQEVTEGDFYIICGDCGYFYVSRETAARVERCLDRIWMPRWVTFWDLSGSRVRVFARHVNRIVESTAAQRARDREFERARKLEEKADRRPWEDD